MARIRSIKPEFFTSEQIAECSANARLMLIGLLCFADDSGIHPDSCARIKMEIFPSDEFSREQIEEWLRELESVGLVVRYSVKNQRLVRVTGFTKHQKIDQPTYRFPLESGVIPANVRRTSFVERSPYCATSVHGGKGEEVKSNSKSKSALSREELL